MGGPAMTIPCVFYTVLSERDGSYDEPLCWEQQAAKGTRSQAERDRVNTPAAYGRTWIVECRVLLHTEMEASDDE